MTSIAISHHIVSQFLKVLCWTKNRWRYSFTSFFPCHFCLEYKVISFLLIFFERLQLALDLERKKILREKKMRTLQTCINEWATDLVCICVTLRNVQCNFFPHPVGFVVLKIITEIGKCCCLNLLHSSRMRFCKSLFPRQKHGDHSDLKINKEINKISMNQI